MNHKRVPYVEQLEAARSFIQQYDDFLVVSHVHPDGDAVSSTCAVGWLLHHLGKQYTMINAGSIPEKFQFLWGCDRIMDFSQHPLEKKFDVVICVDCADFSRIGKVSDIFSDDVKILNIDHHPTNDYYGTVQCIKDDAAATAEILFDLFEHMNVEWTTELAACVYTGLLTDTGGFRFANTSPKVMEMAAFLLHMGVNANQMAEQLLETRTLAHIQLLIRALNSLSFSKDHKISWVTITLEDMRKAQALNHDLEGIVNYPRNIEGVEVGILFKELEDQKVKASFRSAGKVNVAQFAKMFGGGGHILASGATLEGTIEDIVPKIISELEKVVP